MIEITATKKFSGARKLILETVASDPKSRQEITEAMLSMPEIKSLRKDEKEDVEKKIAANITSAVSAGLLLRRSDDGDLIYSITDNGKSLLKSLSATPVVSAAPKAVRAIVSPAHKAAKTVVTPTAVTPVARKTATSKVAISKTVAAQAPRAKKSDKSAVAGSFVILEEGTRLIMKDLSGVQCFATGDEALAHANDLVAQGASGASVLVVAQVYASVSPVRSAQINRAPLAASKKGG